jgi:eukaryotic-like serine/threonine-protein kinase
MNTGQSCPACGASLPGDAPQGLCPVCLAAAAGGPETPSPGSSSGRPLPLRGFTVRYFGDYELLGELARGGMGIVYYARQISLQRAVALKIIRSGQLAGPAEIERFHTEAQAAANLDHPNIVPLYEIGQHEGHHYFSMKLIEGGNLAERISSSKFQVSNREAARLVAAIARAVHHAHQRGVLHRDLKPTNILLDPEGDPHLTDFGLAKLLQSERGASLTQSILGTPGYMAPEQAAGDSKGVTTAADIYSLGAILYELLTGQPPFTGASPIEILRRVLEEQPVRPSHLHRRSPPRPTGPKQKSEVINHKPPLDRDLETICLKCLDKEPARRYPTAEALAGDLEHWLAGEPIQARPTTPIERARKWARRNPAVAALVVLANVLLIAGIAGVLWQWHRAELHAVEAAEQARRAQAGARSARDSAAHSAQVAQLLKEMLEGVGPAVALGRDTTLLREILDRTAERIETSLQHQPEVELELRQTLGDVYHELGEFEAAEAMFRRALEIRQQLGRSGPVMALTLDDLADALRSQAHLVSSELLHRPASVRTPPAQKVESKLAEAERLYRQALEIREAIWGDDHPEVADSLERLATIAYYQRRLPEAEPLARDALAMARRSLPDDHRAVLTKMNNLAMILGDLGKLDEADTLYRQNLTIQRQRLPDPHPTLVNMLTNLGLILKRQGRWADAETVYAEALDMERRLARSEHPNLPALLNELADVLRKQGKLVEAEPLVRESLQVRIRLFGDEHVEVAAALDNLALVLAARRKFDEAELLHEQALAMRRRLLGSEHSHVAGSLNSLSILRERQGRLAESETLLRQAIDIERRLADDTRPYAPELPGSSLLVSLLDDLAHLLQRQGGIDQAEDVLAEALEYLRRDTVTGSALPTPALAKMLHHLADALRHRHALADARLFAEEAIELYARHPGWHRGERNHALEVYRDVLSDQGDWEAVERLDRDRVEELRAELPPDSPELAGALANWVNTLLSLHRFIEAEAVARESLAIREQRLPGDWRAFNARSLVGAALLGQKNHAEAEPLLVSGYEGMRQREGAIPAAGRVRLKEAARRLVQLYEETSRPQQAAQWKQKLEELD